MAQIIFRDGPREVPPHVEDLLRGIETYKYTYKEAIARMNQRMVGGFVDKHVSKTLTEHFRGGR